MYTTLCQKGTLFKMLNMKRHPENHTLFSATYVLGQIWECPLVLSICDVIRAYFIIV